MFASAQLTGRLMARLAPRTLIVPGLAVAATGMILLTGLAPDSSYAACVLPAEILLGIGMGAVFTPAISLATSRTEPGDAGIAAAVVATSQQIGGSLGVAVLNTIAATATAAYLAFHPATTTQTAALVAGYTTAATWAAALLIAAALLAAVLITAGRPDRPGAVAGTTHHEKFPWSRS